MVLHKGSQKRGILAVGFDRVDHVVQVTHTTAGRLKCAQKGEISYYMSATGSDVAFLVLFWGGGGKGNGLRSRWII